MQNLYSLDDLLDFVKTNNNYYKNKYKNCLYCKDIESLPILTRDEIRNNSLISDPFKTVELIQDMTNGTTENLPLNIYKSKKELFELDMILWKNRRQLYSSAGKRYGVYYYNKQHSIIEPDIKIVSDKISVRFPIIKANEKCFINDLLVIKELQLDWIICPPSVAFELACISERNNINIKLKFVELISEYLPEIYKNKIENEFQCKTIVQYSCHEVWGIAFQSHNNDLLPMQNIVLETKKESRFERDIGNCIVTNLSLYSMPFIRYFLSDLIIKDDEKIKTFGFRSIEEVVLLDRHIHCSFFDNILYGQFNLSPLEDYQILYEQNKIFFLYLTNISNDLQLIICNLIKQAIKQDFGIIVEVFSTKVKKFFIDTISGKMRGIVSVENINKLFLYYRERNTK